MKREVVNFIVWALIVMVLLGAAIVVSSESPGSIVRSCPTHSPPYSLLSGLFADKQSKVFHAR